jgi:hypothetical protein
VLGDGEGGVIKKKKKTATSAHANKSSLNFIGSVKYKGYGAGNNGHCSIMLTIVPSNAAWAHASKGGSHSTTLL